MTDSETKIRSHWPLSLLAGLAALINMFLPLALVRILTPEEIGAFKVFFLYITVVPHLCFTIGVMNGLSYWAGRGEEGRKAVQASALVMLVMAVFMAFVTAAGSAQFAMVTGWSEMVCMLFALASFGALAGGVFEEAAIATGSVLRGALFHSAWEIVRTAVIITSVLYWRSLNSVLYAHVAITLLKAFSAYAAAFSMDLFRFSFDVQALKNIWRYACPVSAAGVLGIFVHYADQLLLSQSISAADFAFYSIGCLAIPPLFILEQSVTRMLIPQMSEAFSQNRSRDAAGLYRQAVAQLGVLLIPSVLGLMIYAKPLVEILFTKQYAYAANFLVPFALSYAFLIIPHDAVPRARGEARWILKTCAVFSLVSLTLVASLGWAYGAFGALAAVLIYKAAMRCYAVYYIRSSTNWRYAEFLPLPELTHALTVSIALAVCIVSSKPLFASELAWFLVTAPIFAVSYLLALWQSRFKEQQGSRSTRVVMVLQQLNIGGMERMVVDLCIAQKRRGDLETVVFAYDHKESGDQKFVAELRQAGIVTWAHEKAGGFSPRSVWLLVCLVRETGAQIIHSHNLGGLIYAGLAKIILCGSFRLVHTQHSFVHLADKRRYVWYERLFVRLVDELACVSENTRKTYLELGAAARRTHVIPNGIYIKDGCACTREEKLMICRDLALRETCEDSRAMIENLRGAYWILYLARLHPIKGQKQAIALWESLPVELRAQSALLFVGPEAESGELKRLQDLRARASDSERIVFAGGTSNPEWWYRASDVFLSCSEFEGMPLAPLEALAYGLPAVLSGIPGHAFLRERAVIYDKQSDGDGAGALSIALKRVMESGSKEHDPLIAANSLWISDNFSVSNMAKAYCHLYELRRPGNAAKKSQFGVRSNLPSPTSP